MTAAYLVFGFPALILGAYFLIRGSSSIAARFGISDLVIGLTVVAMGTSLPELVVSLLSASRGIDDVALGNVVGSNMVNLLLILGLCAVIQPLEMQTSIRWKEIPFSLMGTVVLLAFMSDTFLSNEPSATISRGEGIAFIMFFLVYLYYVFSTLKKEEVHDDAAQQQDPVFKALALVILGLLGLYFGGDWIVRGATALALSLGMSQALIGVTIVAVGTSLPEFATSLVAALKGNADMAVGNVVGSNIFNILWILGLSALITPLKCNQALIVDVSILTVATCVFFIFTFTGKRHKVDRWEGALFVLTYAAYLIYVLHRG